MRRGGADRIRAAFESCQRRQLAVLWRVRADDDRLDLTLGDPLQPFFLAAGSKLVCASIVAQLRDDGALDWDRPVAEYVPHLDLHPARRPSGGHPERRRIDGGRHRRGHHAGGRRCAVGGILRRASDQPGRARRHAAGVAPGPGKASTGPGYDACGSVGRRSTARLGRPEACSRAGLTVVGTLNEVSDRHRRRGPRDLLAASVRAAR